MPTTTFPIAVNADDGKGQYEHSAWPPNPGTWVDGTDFAAAKTLFAAVYYNPVAFMRWDTSSIPDGSTISSANLEVYITNIDGSGDNYSLVGDYYDFGGSPTVAADWVETASPSIFTAVQLSVIPELAVFSIALTDLSGISTTGYTGIRLTLSAAGGPSSGGSEYGQGTYGAGGYGGNAPTDLNAVHMANLEDAVNQEPRLVVTHSLTAPSTYVARLIRSNLRW